MSEKYSKTDLRHIAENLIEDLRECEDGTDITTWQLVKAAGYDMDEFGEWDLFDVHDALFRAAKANHITLDMSAHDGLVEGLPYNLDFIVHNKRAQIKCPYCGSKNTARYIYGYPLYDEKMQRKLNDGKWVLGGCCISSVEIDGRQVDTMPGRKCNDCKKDFASAPILYTPKMNQAEDYRDIVTSIKFSVGGFFGGYTEVTIRKNEKGASVKVQKTLDYEDLPDPRQITREKWNTILNTLYCEIYLHEWKKKYVDLSVLDGTQWSLDINLTNKRVRHYYGSNDYPPYWSELKKIFKKLEK